MWGVAVQLSRGRAAVNAREGGAALRCSEVELLPPPHCSAPGWVFPRGHQQPVPLEAHSGQGCVGRSGPAPSLGFKGHGSNLEAGVWVTARVEGQQCRPAGCASTSGRGPGRALPTAAGLPLQAQVSLAPRAESQPRREAVRGRPCAPVDGEPGTPAPRRLLEPRVTATCDPEETGEEAGRKPCCPLTQLIDAEWFHGGFWHFLQRVPATERTVRGPALSPVPLAG